LGYVRHMEGYDQAAVASTFDEYGEREWDRHDATVHDRVAFELHRALIADHVRPGDRVLEIGAGPGRFTIELVRLGATVVVGDVSPRQLEINRSHVGEAGAEHGVDDRVLADVVDLSSFADASFDAVVCFGGPLSYVLHDRDRAADELLRVTKRGRPVMLSVMSRYGSFRAFFAALRDDAERLGVPTVQAVFETGDLPQEMSSTAPNHLFTASELREMLERRGADVVSMSASNFLSLGEERTWWTQDPERWARLVEWERVVCASPGALDGGTHIIAVAMRS
jgi:ubiquinone/menaquinone biosynthesis C-methylase UbiE